MPRSADLRAEAAAMARIEAAFASLDKLPAAAAKRVRQWAAEEYPAPSANGQADE